MIKVNHKRKLDEKLASSGSLRIGKQDISDQTIDAGDVSMSIPLGILEVLALLYSCEASAVNGFEKQNYEEFVEVSRKMVGDILKQSLPVDKQRIVSKQNGTIS